jgi:hypothetical protein
MAHQGGTDMTERSKAAVAGSERFLRTTAAWAVAVFASVALPALAADGVKTIEEDPFNLSLGAYFVYNTNATLRLDRTVGVATIGTSLNWERDLGGETSLTVPRIDGYYRFAPKHRVDFSWYKIERGGQIVTQRDIVFGDASFQAGTPINSAFDTETTKLTYTYSFYRKPEIETALSMGLHVTKLDMSIQSPLGISESETVTAPLPVFGFRLDYAITPKWWVRTKYELFFLDSADEIEGAYSDFTLSVEHRTFQHVGFGLGLNRNALDFDVSSDNKRGAVNSVLNGYMLYVFVR